MFGFKTLPVLTMIVAGITTPSQALQAGNSSGGGGEFVTTEQNPWFIGEAPVRYCVQIDSDAFSADGAAIDMALGQVLATWAETINALNPVATPAGDLDGTPRSLTTAFVKEPCGASTELRFEFGRHDQEIADLLKQFARYTVSFAKQVAFDDVTGRAHGLVWVAGDRGPTAYMGPHDPGDFWSAGSTLYNVLLHEMGHAYGFGHSHTGAMVAEVPEWAVLGGSGTRYSIRDKVLQQWQRTGVPVCGWLVADDQQDYIEHLFGLPHDQPVHACLTTTSATTYALTITADGTAVGRWAITKTGQWNRFNPSLDTIVGQYRKMSRPGTGDFPWLDYHTFVSGAANDILMEFAANGRKAQMVTQTLDDRLRFVLSADADGKPHYFEISFPLVVQEQEGRHGRLSRR